MTRHALIAGGDGLHARLILSALIKSENVPQAVFCESGTKLSQKVGSFLREAEALWPESVSAMAQCTGIEFVSTDHMLADASVERLMNIDPEYVVCGGCRILPKSFIDNFRGRIINAHPGLLPEFRGLDPVLWAVSQGAVIGATLHLVDEGIDSGAILLRRNLAWQGAVTILECRIQCMALCAELVAEFLANPESHTPVAQPSGQKGSYPSFPGKNTDELEAMLGRYRYDQEIGNTYVPPNHP